MGALRATDVPPACVALQQADGSKRVKEEKGSSRVHASNLCFEIFENLLKFDVEWPPKPFLPNVALQVESVSSTLLLYHGCRFRQIDGILRDGFDPTFAGEKGGKLFGPGIYFSDVAAKVGGVKADLFTIRCAVKSSN